MATSLLSPELKERYSADLTATLDRLDALAAEKAEVAKLFREANKTENERKQLLRDLLAGRVSQQTAIPGLEGPSKSRVRLGNALRRAVDRVQELTGVEPMSEDDEPPAPDEPSPAVRRAVRRFVDNVPEGTTMTVSHTTAEGKTRSATVVGKGKRRG